MSNAAPVRVIILGAGKGGTALLELFSRSPRVRVLGIADINPDAPGLRLAEEQGIQTYREASALLADCHADLIIDVSGDAGMAALIQEHKPPHAEVLGGSSALLIWELTSQYERDLREQMIQAEKLATVETLASGIAHEINNPLYIITGFAEHLRNETRPDFIGKYVEAISESAQRIARIIRDITVSARRAPIAGAGDFEINTLLDDAISVACQQIRSERVKVLRNYDSILRIQGKREELLQVFVNIVTNALQAMDGNGILDVSTTNSSGYVQATIRDDGPGISQNNLSKIFDPFFTTKEPGKGIGLGLHIVRDIVTLYGGHVTVESRPGRGAAFTVKLPAVPRFNEEKLSTAPGAITT
jgi:signal transduction histidine kinase